MRTIQTPIYNFEDILANKELLAKVLEKNRYHNDNNLSYLVEDFEIQCKAFGLEISETYYTGFGSQGDGACFVGTYQAKKDCLETIKQNYPTQTVLHNCVERLEELRLLCGGFLRIEISHSGHYYHENSMEYDGIVDEDFGEHLVDVVDEARQIFKNLAKELYKTLVDDYSYQTSDDGLTEYFKDSDLEFLEDGSIFSE